MAVSIYFLGFYSIRCPPDLSKIPVKSGDVVQVDTTPAGTGPQYKKKSKVLAKEGGLNSQWEIMQSMGLSDADIPQFIESEHWLRYFPDFCKKDLKSIGLKVSLQYKYSKVAYYESA